jgi:hypothetical protein
MASGSLPLENHAHPVPSISGVALVAFAGPVFLDAVQHPVRIIKAGLRVGRVVAEVQAPRGVERNRTAGCGSVETLRSACVYSCQYQKQQDG